jgi:hypothetical protein
MIRFLLLKKIKMSTKIQNKDLSKKLYNLLSDAEVISDAERVFWLENFSNLLESAQNQLAKIIQHGEHELQKERDDHMNRMAEISTKCVANLHKVAVANDLRASAGGDDDVKPYDKNDDEEIFKALERSGEYHNE